MAPNYQAILGLMNLILIACAGFTMIGLYRILKVFGLIPWEVSTPGGMTLPGENKGLDTDLMLPNLQVVGTAFIPGSETPIRVLPGMPLAGTVFIPEVKTQDQAAAVQGGELNLINKQRDRNGSAAFLPAVPLAKIF